MMNFFRRVLAISPLSGDFFRPRGFTLIEMSVVLAIAGVLTGGALGAYKVVVAEQYLRTTKDRMTQIQQAMVRYQSATGNINKHLPCPAPLHAAPGDANFGVEDVDTAGNLNCSTTGAGTAPYDDTFRAVDGSLGAPNTVRVGGVPWRTLEIPMQTAYDAWGHRFLYAVSENLADPDPAPTYSATNGVITIKDPSGTPLPNKAPFVLISLGKSGLGSVTAVGKNSPIACPAPGTPEGDNCDWAAPDTVFGERTYSEASNPNSRFDDHIVHTLDDIAAAAGPGGANYIDKLDDGISDWPALTTPSNVFLGNNSGAAMDGSYTPQPNNIGGGNTSAGINNFAYNFFPQYGKSSGSTALGMEALPLNNGNFNTASGYQALYHNYRWAFMSGDNYGYNNTATGTMALWANTLGYENTATGFFALYANNGNLAVGVENTATGVGALGGNIEGTFNTATGMYALAGNTDGTSNTAFGIQALYSSKRKSNLTAIGALALFNADATVWDCGFAMRAVPGTAWAAGLSNCDSNNTAVGYQALYGSGVPTDNTGIANTAIGTQALSSNTSGLFNTAAGMQALFSNKAKSGSTAVGYQALQFADDTTTGSYSNSTAVGAYALKGSGTAANNTGSNNTAVGFQSLTNNIGGGNNVAVGSQALYGNTGYAGAPEISCAAYDNTAVGYQALYSNQDAGYNTAVGTHALYSNQTCKNVGGEENTAVGAYALYNNVRTGGNNNAKLNTAVGAYAIYSSSDGTANTALGGEAFYAGLHGQANTAVGYQALYYADDTTTSSNNANTGVGYQAMYQNTGEANTAVGAIALSSAIAVKANTAAGYGAGISPIPPSGQANTFIGYQAGPSGDQVLDDVTAIGANAQVYQAPGTVQIGDNNVTDIYFGTVGGTNAGDFGIFTGAPGNATAHAGHYNSPSDLRLKKDIRDSDLGLDFIEKLRPVSYFYKTGDKPMSYGFIAQEVEKALGDRATSMVTRQNDKLKTYELNYSEIISPLVKAVQEFAMNMLNSLEKTVADLSARFSPVEEAVRKHQLSLAQQQDQLQSLLKTMSEMKSEMDALKAGK